MKTPRQRPSRKGLPIRAHKGGRSERMPAWRATPLVKTKLEAMMRVWEMTYADALNFLLGHASVPPLVKSDEPMSELDFVVPIDSL